VSLAAIVRKLNTETTFDIDEFLAGVEIDHATKLYLRQACHHPLLKLPDERHLATLARLGRDAQGRLKAGKARDGDEEAAEEGKQAGQLLARHNLRLVVSLAARYQGHGVPLSDLIQEGNAGMLHGLKKFDERRGYRFSTYATWWIRQAVRRAVENQSRTVRVPVHMHERARDIRKVEAMFRARYGKDPTDEEIGLQLKHPLSAEQVAFARESLREETSLEQHAFRDDGDDAMTVADSIADAGPGPQEVLETGELNATMDRLIREVLSGPDVDPRAERILRMRFGLTESGESFTLQQLSERFGLSRERIRQLEQEALKKLRHPASKRKLKSFLE
jgi:RNA polymerase primary sigma factor